MVTTDALGCQKSVAEAIIAGQADYLLQLKENQPTLLAKTKNLLDEAILEKFKDVPHDTWEQTEAGHGRIETRKLWVIWNIEDLKEAADGWKDLRSLIAVERTRNTNGKTSSDRQYYISSLDRRSSAKRLAGCVRGHWGVENNLHWQLDVSFAEDQRRIRKDHGAENFSRLCRISLMLLKAEKTMKCGIKGKRKCCGWSNDYILTVLKQSI